MNDLFNARDLGGYRTDTGQVKWGVLYRTGDLFPLSPGDREILERLNIRTIVDFRNKTERSHAPDGEISTVEGIYTLSIDAGNILDLSKAGPDPDPEAMMDEFYRLIVRGAIPQYREFFRLLSEKSRVPLLFHCSAGKDRTGIGAALLLTALGVERETVYRDYLLSAGYLKDKYAEYINANPRAEPFLTVRRRYIDAAFGCIEQEFGGIETYLREILLADPARLREYYTEQ
jgi:protein-tyrosine phosphatase